MPLSSTCRAKSQKKNQFIFNKNQSVFGRMLSPIENHLISFGPKLRNAPYWAGNAPPRHLGCIWL